MSVSPPSAGLRRAARVAVSTVLAFGMSAGAVAEVRTSTQIHSYYVSGTNARSLVSYMRSHPFHGDGGDAVANVRPSYRLSASTTISGGTCRASRVTLSISFVMTLPRARSASSMSASTRGAWNSFTAFASRHENTHKSIYVQCGNAFVARAQRLTASNCAGLQASIRRLLETEKRACEIRQRAFDRSEYRRLSGLSLFQLAKSSR